jgi:hypothetical protein
MYKVFGPAAEFILLIRWRELAVEGWREVKAVSPLANPIEGLII